MTPRFLLDTNIVSEPLRAAPSKATIKRLRTHAEEIAIPSIVYHEIWFGALRLPVSKRRSLLEHYIETVVGPTMPILDYDSRAAKWHAAERARLVSDGNTPPFADGQIASIAAVHGLILVTRNTADFTRFRGIEVLDW